MMVRQAPALFLVLCGWLALAVVLVTTGCARHPAAQTSNPLDDQEHQAADYVSQALPLADTHGFVDTQTDKCDSLLFSCLAMIGGAKVDYLAAQDPSQPGRWYRDSGRTCTVDSKQTAAGFSRDMAIGLAFCLWQAGDMNNVKAFLAYTDGHGGQMAPDGDQSIAAIQPLVHYLYETMVAKSDGASLPVHPGNPDPSAASGAALTVGTLTGPEAHITMLGIYLDGLMHGSLLGLELDEVKAQVSREPSNAFFQMVLHKYTDGDQTAALSVLNDHQFFPALTLPTSAERSTDYLWQRDSGGADWSPGLQNPALTFSGTDYTFVVAALANELRETP